jgi:hypothetical protein
MHHFTPSLLLVAEDRLEYLTRGFRQRPTRIEPGEIMISVGAVVAFLLALWLLSRWVDSRQRQSPTNSRLALFASLCRAHQLEWREWILLWWVARKHRLRDPACIFLEPQRFAPEGLGRGFRSQAARLESLRKRLFAGLPTETGAAGAQTPGESG